MKKILAMVLSFALLLCVTPLGAIPVAAATSGTTGDCTWVLDGTHLIISGEGKMGNYRSQNINGYYRTGAPWGWMITSVTIEDGVTTVGEYAFCGCDSLTSVTIGDSVTSIGTYTFRGCTSLTSVTIGDSVTSIGVSAFYYCTSLTSVTIGDSVTSIGIGAFAYCDSLTSVTIPDSVTSIGMVAFAYCTSLTSVTIGDSVTSIGSNAFCDCDSLTSVTIPDSVTTIGEGAFEDCASLTEIVVADANPNYCSVDGVLFNKEMTTLIQCPGGKIGAYSIPDSVTSVGDSAFHDCTSLTSVTIGDSVTTIGEDAFYSCDALTSVTIGDSVTTIGEYAFARCDSLKTVHYHGTEEDKAAIDINSYNDDLTSATWHYYDNGCDAECNVCKYQRTPPHNYADEKDDTCDTCGQWREVILYTSGDGNGDGKVNNKDLGLLQQYLNEWDVTIVIEAADLNEDGKINNKDLGLLQRLLNE